ncbi:MAG: YjbQ family protein [Deltaproteobacteria bacterium]|nr:YjbQ family protein [Deltaproteobacteria bacterium]
MIRKLTILTRGPGLVEISNKIDDVLREVDIEEGLCTVFIPHTSASLIVQENADPSARLDLEGWMNRLVQESDPNFTHRFEGTDDMPAHIKTALTATSVAIPIIHGQLALGTWQGVFLWEHRRHEHNRSIILHII